MLNQEDRRQQERLALAVVALRHPSRQQADALELRFAERLLVYQESFIGRTVSALADVVLAPACQLFGAACVKEIVARYFSEQPPQGACMVEALAGLPGFLSRKGDGILAAELGCLTDACLAHWHLLSGPDPLPEHNVPAKLSGPARLIKAVGSIDLAQPFQEGDPVAAPVAGQGVSVLFVKTGPALIVAAPVFKPLVRLAEGLAAGHDLSSVIGDLREEDIEAMPPAMLQEFLLFLQAYAAL